MAAWPFPVAIPNRAGIIVRDHHDEPGTEDHQEGEQIERPLGFHDSPADRCHFVSHGRRQYLVVHDGTLLPVPAQTRGTSRSSADAQAGKNPSDEMSKGVHHRSRDLERLPQPSALTTKPFVEDAAAEAKEKLSDHRNSHAVSSSTRRLIVVRFHIPFWRRSKLRREIKSHFPRSGRNGQLSQAIPDGFPHWSKLQHRTP